MTFDEQDSLIESLNAAYDKAGTLQMKTSKNCLPRRMQSLMKTSKLLYEFDEFFAEVVSKMGARTG